MSQTANLHIASNIPLPSPRSLMNDIAPTEAQTAFVAKSRQEIRDILFGSDSRFLVILGPCSIHDPEAGLEYARKLAALAEELNRLADKMAKTMPILLEVNVAGEGSKFGYPPKAVLAEFARVNALRRLEVHGLMTVAPYSPTPERVRPVFRQLRELREQCEQILGAPLPVLSMGMSGDFEVAIEEGATLIRVGTALFGARAAARKEAAAAAGEENEV